MRNLETLRWIGGVDGHLRMIDQTLLPVEFTEIECRDVESVWEACGGLWRVCRIADRRGGR